MCPPTMPWPPMVADVGVEEVHRAALALGAAGGLAEQLGHRRARVHPQGQRMAVAAVAVDRGSPCPSGRSRRCRRRSLPGRCRGGRTRRCCWPGLGVFLIGALFEAADEHHHPQASRSAEPSGRRYAGLGRPVAWRRCRWRCGDRHAAGGGPFFHFVGYGHSGCSRESATVRSPRISLRAEGPDAGPRRRVECRGFSRGFNRARINGPQPPPHWRHIPFYEWCRAKVCQMLWHKRPGWVRYKAVPLAA